MAEGHENSDEISEEPLDALEQPTSALGPGPAYSDLLNSQTWQVDSAELNDADAPSSPSDLAPSKRNQNHSSDGALSRLESVVEALLFIGGGPLTVEQACAVVPKMTGADFLRSVDTLNRAYRIQGRPYFIRVSTDGCEMNLRPRFRPVVEKMSGAAREARLSGSALDVLSLVAYRQPLTKQDIDAMRGAESGGILRQLVRRGLLTVEQTETDGKADSVYRTTRRFVEFFQLRGLEDLPQTQDLQRL
jgi:segregation and condensation protein B